MGVIYTPARPLEDPLFMAWENRLRRLRRDPRTLANFAMAARAFEQYLYTLGVGAADVEPWQVEEYFGQLDLAPSTKRQHLSLLRAAYRYAWRRGVMGLDPTEDVQIEREPDKEPRIVPTHCLREQRARISTDRAWAAFHLLAFGGLRRVEVRELTWADVDYAGSTLRVLGKGGKLRHVPMHPALAEALQSLHQTGHSHVIPGRRRGTAISNLTFANTVREFTDAYTAHDYRRTVASSLYANGVETDTIDKIMGWAPRAVRSRYYVNVAPAQLQRAILRLYANDPV